MISIIIPTINEAEKIGVTISKAHSFRGDHAVEIIIADGGSTDDTVPIVNAMNATVIRCGQKGRAIQMNYGATFANGDILYFLHADTVPPENYTGHIMNACANGAVGGCFRLSFDYAHWFLKTQCWFTRFDITAVRFGDQSLFVRRDVFEKCKGFNEDLMIMEDQEIISRIKKYGRFSVMNANVTTSARKYLENGIFKMQGIFYRLWLLYYLGYPQERLVKLHRNLIRDHKL